jgi:hypothetical protein
MDEKERIALKGNHRILIIGIGIIYLSFEKPTFLYPVAVYGAFGSNMV